MLEIPKEKMNKSPTEIEKNTTFQHKCLKAKGGGTGKGSEENFSRSENGNRSNKTQTEEILEIENLGEQTGITKLSINGVQEMEERISGIKDIIEEIDLLIENS